MKQSNYIIWVVVAVLVVVAIGFYAFGKKISPNVPVQNEVGLPAEQGKLNINVVCESALSYMSFENGDAAARFVEECKAGEHPEVIERYKADMGYGDGRAI